MPKASVSLYRGGWMLYVGPFAGSLGVVAGEALSTDLTMESPITGPVRIHFRADLFRPVMELDVASMDEGLVRALASWRSDDRDLPDDLAAMFALAERHPEEFAELREEAAKQLRRFRVKHGGRVG